jgi:hypothetical protein
VLAELGELRHRTRADRHALAVPLLVFGALILVAPLLYTTGAFGEPGPLARFLGVQLGVDKANPNLIAWYWLATLAGGVAATVCGTAATARGPVSRPAPGRPWSPRPRSSCSARWTPCPARVSPPCR